jgi:hypothetical protein
VGVLILLATSPARWFATPATANTPFGRRLFRDLAAADPVGNAACCDAQAMFDMRGDLRRISVPALVVGGVLDVATPVTYAQELVAGIAHATLKIFDTAHLAVEDPRALRAVLPPHDLQELRDILDRCRSAATVEDFVAHDIAFHLRIVEAVGNPVLSMLLEVFSTRTQRVRIVRGSRTHDALDSAHQDHEEILRTLQARDALLAVSAATVHITAVEQWLVTSCVDDTLHQIDG